MTGWMKRGTTSTDADALAERSFGQFARIASPRWCRLVYCTRHAVDRGLCAEHGACFFGSRRVPHVHTINGPLVTDCEYAHPEREAA